MITYRQVDDSYIEQYGKIPMCFEVESIYAVEMNNRGRGGITFTETAVETYIKDFCTGENESVLRWRRWDITNWAFFMAFDEDQPIGAATIVSKTPDIYMLSGRDDLAVLWDIRVDDRYKRQGIGKALFDMAVEWSRARGLIQIKIECQNNNVPAVKFYHKQGAVLGSIDKYAYYNEPDYRDETQLIWYLDL